MLNNNQMIYLIRKLLYTLLLAASFSAHAVTFTSVTAIGDSMFDGGIEETAVISAYKSQPFQAAPEYYNYKYTNSYTSVEYFAFFMGMYNPEQFFNYGLAGSASEDLPFILNKLYARTSVLDPTGIYVMMIGGHDIFESIISIQQTAINTRSAVESLHAHGAQYFIVLNLPRFTDLPNYNDLPQDKIEIANYAYKTINAALKKELDALPYAENIVQFDMENVSNIIENHAIEAGFSNIDDGCFNFETLTACDTPDTYIYWDDIHFSNKTNSFLGNFMRSELLATFPN